MVQNFVDDPRSKHQDRHNPESAPKFTADLRTTVFSKSAKSLDSQQKCTIRAFFKAKLDPSIRKLGIKRLSCVLISCIYFLWNGVKKISAIANNSLSTC